jgi:hypothetical protein
MRKDRNLHRYKQKLLGLSRRAALHRPMMTPAKERREEEKLTTAIRRWYRLGGKHDKILEIADQLHVTKAASLPEKSDG